MSDSDAIKSMIDAERIVNTLGATIHVDGKHGLVARPYSGSNKSLLWTLKRHLAVKTIKGDKIVTYQHTIDGLYFVRVSSKRPSIERLNLNSSFGPIYHDLSL